MTRVVLVHGWGYDARIWDGVRAVLNADLVVEVVDFGFFGQERKVGAGGTAQVGSAGLMGTAIDLAVGHSLGALWWLTQAELPWRRLLSINGFPRFTEVADYAPAVAPRMLARMRTLFAREPLPVLADFHERCGGHAPGAAPDVSRLQAGLDWLADWDGRSALADRRKDVYALAGNDDPIVPPAMSAMAFPTQCEFVAAPGHLLPQTHPALCAAWINRLVA